MKLGCEALMSESGVCFRNDTGSGTPTPPLELSDEDLVDLYNQEVKRGAPRKKLEKVAEEIYERTDGAKSGRQAKTD